MEITIIANEASYGNERTYNSFRVAMHLIKREDVRVNVFLMADAVTAALIDQKTPEGYYNIMKMIKIIGRKAKIGACGSCMDARGIQNIPLISSIHRSNMEELTDWIIMSDKVIVF